MSTKHQNSNNKGNWINWAIGIIFFLIALIVVVWFASNEAKDNGRREGREQAAAEFSADATATQRAIPTVTNTPAPTWTPMPTDMPDFQATAEAEVAGELTATAVRDELDAQIATQAVQDFRNAQATEIANWTSTPTASPSPTASYAPTADPAVVAMQTNVANLTATAIVNEMLRHNDFMRGEGATQAARQLLPTMTAQAQAQVELQASLTAMPSQTPVIITATITSTPTEFADRDHGFKVFDLRNPGVLIETVPLEDIDAQCGIPGRVVQRQDGDAWVDYCDELLVEQCDHNARVTIRNRYGLIMDTRPWGLRDAQDGLYEYQPVTNAGARFIIEDSCVVYDHKLYLRGTLTNAGFGYTTGDSFPNTLVEVDQLDMMVEEAPPFD